MKVLIISKDVSIFDPRSPAHRELLQYSHGVEALHVIICTSKKDPYTSQKIGDKLFLHPVPSRFNALSFRRVSAFVQSQLLEEGTLPFDLICAQDSLRTSISAYLLSKKYNRNFIVDISENSSLSYNAKSIFPKRIHTKILNAIFRKASGIRVTNQTEGEIISAHNSSLEKKIFILPFPKDKPKEILQTSEPIDIRKKFPQFNVIILSVNSSMEMKDLKKAKLIMDNLRLRYPRIGLVIVTPVKNFGWHPFFKLPDSIVLVEPTSESDSYFEHATLFMDLQTEIHPVDELIKAIHAGCAVVVSDTRTNRNIVRDGENGLIVDSKIPTMFVRKVVEVLETPGLRHKMRMYRFDITDLYGDDPRDYYKRLIDLWETCKTPEKIMHIKLLKKVPVVPEPLPQVIAPAFKPLPKPEPKPEPEQEPEPQPTVEVEPEPELVLPVEEEPLPIPVEPVLEPLVQATLEPLSANEVEKVEIIIQPKEAEPTTPPPVASVPEQPKPSPLYDLTPLPKVEVRVDYYPTLTLDIVKKAFKLFEKKATIHTARINAFPENEFFDVDAVKIGLKQALKEIIVEKPQPKEESEWGPDIEIIK